MKVIVVSGSQGRIECVCILNADEAERAVGILSPLAEVLGYKVQTHSPATLTDVAEYLRDEAKDA
jgi:hypothetical protein